jgi:hypothetical protein
VDNFATRFSTVGSLFDSRTDKPLETRKQDGNKLKFCPFSLHPTPPSFVSPLAPPCRRWKKKWKIISSRTSPYPPLPSPAPLGSISLPDPQSDDATLISAFLNPRRDMLKRRQEGSLSASRFFFFSKNFSPLCTVVILTPPYCLGKYFSSKISNVPFTITSFI